MKEHDRYDRKPQINFLKILLYDGNVLRFVKQRYYDANVMDTLIEGLKIGKEKVILMKLQNFGVRMIRLA